MSELMKAQSQSQMSDERKEISAEEKVKDWIQNRVKLSEYTQLLIENGFDTMDSVCEITNEELTEMGMTKMGHRKRFIKHIQALKGTHQSQINREKQPRIAPIAYAPNVNRYVWICVMCDTQNGNGVSQCTLCGLKRNYKKVEIEGPNVVDTAQ